MANSEAEWTKEMRDNLARTIAESNVTDGLLENEDIDALVDLFEAWTERREPSSDAEQLIELRKAMLGVRNGMGCWCITPFVNISESRPHETRCLAVLAALNPNQPQKETQSK